MKITKNTVVTMLYKVVNAQGQLLDKAQEPTSYLHGGYDNTFPKIEAALEGQEVGFATTLKLAPADAFGERDESLVQTIPKSEFPPGVKVGGQLRGRTPDGRDQVFHVLKIKGDQVMLDGNHPWAGQHLTLSLKVQEVRAATEEEVTHRHAHGAHGHHH
jgi:FKBP-type peptidyl-prolyl cis-trans isomerase SlyD